VEGGGSKKLWTTTFPLGERRRADEGEVLSIKYVRRLENSQGKGGQGGR